MAGVDVGTAFLQIVPSARGFSSKLQSEIGGGMSSAGKRSGDEFSRGFGGSVKSLVGVVGGLFAAGKAIDFFKDANAEAREAQKVGALTTNVIKSTGGAAKVTAAQVGDLATALSNKTGVDDEAIQSGANLLLTFKNVKNEVGKGNDVFNRATAAALDLSKAGFGDLSGTSKQLGKALNDPVKGIAALGRAGVTFTAAQKKQIEGMVKSGKTLEAQKIILKEVESQVGGAAAATATAGEKAKVAFDNIKESAGTALLPVIDKAANVFTSKLAPGIQSFFDIVSNNDSDLDTSLLSPMERLGVVALKVKEGVSQVVAALFNGDFKSGPFAEDSGFIDLLFRIRDGFKTITGGVAAFSAAWKANDGDVTSSGFAGVMEKIANLGRKAFGYLSTAIPPVVDAAKQLWPPIRDIAKQLYEAYSSLGISTWDMFKAALSALPDILAAAADALKGVAKWMGENKTLIGALVTALAAGLLAFKAWTIGVKIVTGVTKAYTVVQGLLNAVMAANPITIVVVAIAALVAGLIYAYKTSATFRSYVSEAFSFVKIGALTLAKVAVGAFQFMANVYMTVVGAILDGAAKAFGWVPGLGPKLQGAASNFETFKTNANASLDKIKNDIDVNVNTEIAKVALEELHREFMDKGWTITPEVNMNMQYAGNGRVVPRALGGPVGPGSTYLVGERGPELLEFGQRGHITNARATASIMAGASSSVSNDNSIKGPITVVARDPDDFLRQMQAKQRRANSSRSGWGGTR